MNSVSRFGLLFYSKADDAVKGINTVSDSLNSLSLMMASVSSVAQTMARTLIGTTIDAGKALISQAASMEKTQALFSFAFRDLAGGAEAQKALFNQAVEAGLRSVQTTQEVIDVTKDLKMMGRVNIFDPEMPKLLDSTKTKTLQFVDVVGDMASQLQFGMRSAKFGLMALLNGDYGSAKRHLDPIAGKMDEYEKAAAGAVTQQQKLIKLAPLLARDFGGASAQMAGTWKFITAQFDDIKEKLFNALGTPMMNALKGPMKTIQDFFVGDPSGILLSKNINKLDSVVNVFQDMGNTMSTVASQLIGIGKQMFLFVNAHPNVIKLAAGIVLVTGAVAALTTVLVGAKIALMAFAFSGAGPMTLLIGALTLGAALFARWAVGGKSVLDTWNKLTIVGKAVMEILTTMTGHTAKLSKETYKAANDNGILGLVLKIGGFAYRAKMFFVSLYDTVRSRGDEIYQSFKPGIDAITKAFGLFGDKAKSSTGSWISSGVRVGDVIVRVAKVIGNVFSMIVTNVPKAVHAIAAVAQPFGVVLTQAAKFIEFLSKHELLVKSIGIGFAAWKLATPITNALSSGGGLLNKLAYKVTGNQAFAPKEAGALGTDVYKVFVVNMPGGGLLGGGGGSAITSAVTGAVGSTVKKVLPASSTVLSTVTSAFALPVAAIGAAAITLNEIINRNRDEKFNTLKNMKYQKMLDDSLTKPAFRKYVPQETANDNDQDNSTPDFLYQTPGARKKPKSRVNLKPLVHEYMQDFGQMSEMPDSNYLTNKPPAQEVKVVIQHEKAPATKGAKVRQPIELHVHVGADTIRKSIVTEHNDDEDRGGSVHASVRR